MFRRSAGRNKTHGEKRQESAIGGVPASVPSELCKSGSNEQDTEWLAYSSAPNICYME
jgi:hypothetical protein